MAAGLSNAGDWQLRFKLLRARDRIVLAGSWRGDSLREIDSVQTRHSIRQAAAAAAEFLHIPQVGEHPSPSQSHSVIERGLQRVELGWREITRLRQGQQFFGPEARRNQR